LVAERQRVAEGIADLDMDITTSNGYQSIAPYDPQRGQSVDLPL